MTWYLLLLAAAALAVFVRAGDDRRAQGWVVLGAASFAATYAYGAAGLPYHAAITAMVDTGQCLAIYFFGRFRWEMHLWRVWQASVLLSILHLAGLTGGTWIYAVCLEALNVAALAIIGGRHFAARWADARDNRPWVPRRLLVALRSLCAERREPPFTRGGT